MAAVQNLPLCIHSTSLSDAFAQLQKSGKSGLVVSKGDSHWLYDADTLALHLRNSRNLSVDKLTGGHWLRKVDNEAGALTASDTNGYVLALLDNGRATVGGLSSQFSQELSFAMRMFSCDKDPVNHVFTSIEYRALAIDDSGVRICDHADDGRVR